MIKVKIDCWWTSTQQITDRLIKQFVTSNEQLNNIEFVYDDSYEFLVIFGRPNVNTIIKNPNKTICFAMEPLWSPNYTKNLHEISDYIFIPDKKDNKNEFQYNEHLIYMLYGGHGELNYADKSFDWTYDNLNNINFSKSKKISYIVRNAYESHYNNNNENYKIIYEDRVKIAEYIINESLPIDIYGQNWLEDKRNVKGSIWNKMLGLNDYKFSIASENTIQKNYITEKFWDCILTETIPIYFGCSNFNEYFPELEFFNLTNIIDKNYELDEKLKYILKNNDTLYEQYLPIIKKIKNNYFNNSEYNIFLKIKELINK